MSQADGVRLTDRALKLLGKIDAPSGVALGSSAVMIVGCRNSIHKGEKLCTITLNLAHANYPGLFGIVEVTLPAEAVNDQWIKQLLSDFGGTSSSASYTDEQPFPQRADYVRGYAEAIRDLAKARGGEKVANLRFSYEEMRLAGVDPRTIAAVKDWVRQ